MTLEIIEKYKNCHINCIWCIKYHPSKPIFASCGSDAKIYIWEYDKNMKTYKKASILKDTHKSTIRSLDWDYSGKYLSAASFDNKISIWKIINENSENNYNFSCISILESSDSEIKSVSWSLSGNYLACCSRKGNIWVWEKDEDDFNTEDFLCKSTFEGHKGDVKMVKFSPREDILFSCGFDETIKIWDLDYSKDDFELINTLKGHSGTVWYIDFNKKGDIFFTCSDDKSVAMWKIDFNIETENKHSKNPYENIIKVAVIENVHRRPIYCCVLSFDEKYVFCASNDGDIGIIQIKDITKGGNMTMRLIGKKKDAHEQYNVNCICVNKNKINGNENEILSCGDDCFINLWKFSFVENP
jgi:WD40 repeat protein